MEGAALLEREARFRQMNLELERRTQSLLRHVECAVQKQDTFAEITAADIVSLHEHSSRKSRKCDPPLPTSDNAGKQPQATYKTQKNKNSKGDPKTKADSTGSVPNSSTQQNVCCCLASPAGSEGNTGREFLEAFVSVSVQDNVLPKSFVKEPPNVESICKFLASKVRLLQGQVDKLQALIDKKAAQCEQHLRAVAELEGGRLKLIHSADNLRAQSERHAGRARSLALQLQECERRYTECRGERDRLEVELKRAQGACASAVARRAPLEQAARAQQQQLAARDAADKEFRESCRAQAASQAQALAALEKRNKTLLVALDKQQQLTENLRCQRRLLAAELGAGRVHKEYCELLEAGRL